MAPSYVDASALTKLIVDEPDSSEMRHWYRESERVVCSRVGIIETRRAVGRRAHDPAHLAAILDTVEIFELDAEVAQRAAAIAPTSLKTIDAIHVATALTVLGLGAFVTYDDRQAEAARAAGLSVVRPA